MPVALAGAAVLGISLLLSVAPVLGAAKNGSNGNNAGNGGGGTGSSNVKVHDASTGLEALGSDNEPHVCDFWLEFSMPDPYEAGMWLLLSSAPTGDGSTVGSGTYDTAGDGSDSSSVVHLPSGHYRVEWAATGETMTKKKTFWVDDTCDETVTPAEETPAEDSPLEEPANTTDESPFEEDAPADQPPAENEQDVLSELGSGDESLAEEPAPPADEPVADEPAQAEDPGATDPGNLPVQDQLDSHQDRDGSTMPDTAASRRPLPSGLAATLSLLLLMVGHAIARRSRHPDRA